MLDNKNCCLYFVEEFSPLLKDVKGKIIALTPQVCYQLDREKIPYHIYEDFYDMFERKRYMAGYQERLLSWIDSFDCYLKSKLTDSIDKEINFVGLYGYYISSMIESFVICGKNIEAVLDVFRPSKICLVTAAKHNSSIDWQLFIEEGDLSCYLLPLVCKEKQIAFEIINIYKTVNHRQYIFSKSKHLLRKFYRIFNMLIRGAYLRIIYLAFAFKRNSLRQKGRLKTCLLLRDDWLGRSCEELIKAGYQILYHTIKGPQDLLFYRRMKGSEIEKFYVEDDMKEFWERISHECIKEFSPSRWPSFEAGFNLKEVLDGRFRCFLKKVCPILNSSFRMYEIIFNEKKVNYVIGAYKIIPSDFGVMQAATLNSNVFSVQVEHGGGEIEYQLWHFSEQPANIYITASKEEKLFFEKFFRSSQTEAMAGKVWIDKYEKEAEKVICKSQFKSFKKRRLKILYIPATLGLQRLGSSYPLSWYYLFQKSLCEHFAKLDDYHFIVKIPSAITWYYQSLLRLLNDLKAPNIFLKDNGLVVNLRQADKVIVDYPSTPSYEARLMGLPVLALYHESICVREKAKEIYGKTLCPFREKNEVIEYIDSFLCSNPAGYITPMADNFYSPTLLEIIEHHGVAKINKQPKEPKLSCIYEKT